MLAGSLHFCGWKASIAAPRYRICGDGNGDGAGRGGTLMEKATASAAVDATMATASSAVDVVMATASAAVDAAVATVLAAIDAAGSAN